ncbi:lactonase family protein [Nocardioides carbamazepini]|uniref:lactonase family protein n=1 Tax=Nocardioides carbamazepini TaxID=2854259 RepID=UPI00214A4BFA|nr:lactonase family protein [Nocardioides carbamazepini]MCR1781876.1 lactonase family protein [Nocardioides carbamazepini]
MSRRLAAGPFVTSDHDERAPGMLDAVLGPGGGQVYAVSQRAGGTVHAFDVAGDAWVERSAVSSGGDVPCSVTLSPSGRHLLVANYGSGSVAVLRLEADGSIGERTDLVEHTGSGPVAGRQEAAHVHQVRFDPSGSLVVVTDLGADCLYSYRFDDTTGTLARAESWRNACPPGAGPRHLVFTSERHVVVSDELSSTVSRYDLDPATGALRWREQLAIGAVAAGVGYPSDILLADAGRYAYVGNRGADTVSIIDVGGDALRLVAELPAGRWPLHLTVTAGRLWAACRDSDEVVSWALDETGLAGGVRHTTGASAPLCLLPAP